MKKLLLAACVASFLIGCGGNSSNTTGGGPGGGGGGNTRTYPTFNLSTSALVQTVFLSGQGRTLPRVRGVANSQVAVIRNVRYQNGPFDFIPTGDNNVTDEVRIRLDGYTINSKAFGVQFPVGTSALSFTEFPLEIQQFLEVNPDGTTTALTPSNSIAFTPPVPFDADVRVFPGRVSSVSVRLDDTMVGWNTALNEASFNPDAFILANYNPIYNAMISQFSDYVAFDIGNLDSKPQLSFSGDDAERVYFSGDGYAISKGTGNGSEFELLDPVNVQNGKVTNGPPIGPPGSQVAGANLFILEDTGPDLTRYTSVVGTWKNFLQVINISDTETAVAFPTSRETGTIQANDRQQFVLFKTAGNQVTDLWYGSIFYSVGGNPANNIFKLYPADTIDDAIPANEVTGTISNLVISGGTVRRGDWDVTGTPNNLWPFGDEGGFGVFRR